MGKIHNMPIIILGADINGLGALRSLAQFKPVYIVDIDSERPSFDSRFGKKHIFSSLDNNVVDNKSLIENLHDFRQQFQSNPFIIPTHEETVYCLSDHYDQIKNDFVIQYPSQSTMQKLLNKADFKKIAIENNYLVPKTLSIKSRHELEQVHSLQFPLILKPVLRDSSYSKSFKKAYILKTYDEVKNLYDQINGVMAHVVIQEWIDGGDDQIYFCFQYISQEGELVSSFVGQKINQYPPKTGGTASCISRPDYHDQLTSMTLAFFKAVGGVGFCNMEYKFNHVDQKFYMIEPTVGRTDYQHEVSTINGINILKAAYLFESFGDIIKQNYTKIQSAWVDKMATEKAVLITGKDLMKSLNFPFKIKYCLFRLDDPFPWICSVFVRVKQKFYKLFRGRK